MTWVISYVEENPTNAELLDKAIAWDVAGCPDCSAFWQEQHALPTLCVICGTRGQLWQNYIQMSVNYLAQGKLLIREWTPTPYGDSSMR